MRLFRRPCPTIAVLDLAGEINEAMAMSVLISMRNTDWAKRNIQAVIVRINSNGGSLGAAQAICEGIATLRSEAQLFTVSLTTDTAMSAAFHISVGCDLAIASPAATVVNVGAIIGQINLWPLAEKLGISFKTSRSGSGKGALHPLAAPNTATDAMMAAVVGDISAQFLDWIRQTRNVGQPVLDQIADGRMLSGKQAQALGLVDICGGLFTAIRVVSEKIGASETSLIWLNKQTPSMVSRIFAMVKRMF